MRANYRQIGGPSGLLARRLPFSGNSLAAATNESAWFLPEGKLDGLEGKKWLEEREHVVYVVRSFQTPIAWVLDTGEVYHVEQSFTITTTKHQNLVRAWLK